MSRQGLEAPFQLSRALGFHSVHCSPFTVLKCVLGFHSVHRSPLTVHFTKPMTQPAIKVEGLWKEYIVGHAQAQHSTFYDLLSHTLKAPLKRLRNLGGETPESEKFWALQDVNFEIQPGEVVGVIGRNGAGKSTLLKILSRITAPTKGRIEVRGRLASLLEVGTGFHPELSGRENIFLNGAILGMSRREVARKFDEIVAFAEIEKFIDTPVKRYSSGMYVRLAFAVAAHLEPEILVVDEVLAVGDMQFQEKCLGKLEKIAKGGRTVLFVSHNLTAVKNLCGKAFLLNRGQLTNIGLANDVIEKYLSDLRKPILIRAWDNSTDTPKNGVMALRSVSVRGKYGEPLSTISTDDSFSIELDYEIIEPNASSGMTVILSDSQNNYVFSSINNHEKNWYGKPMSLGRYRSTCLVPGNFLNNGWFRLSINIFGKGFSDAKMLHDVLCFEVQDGAFVRGDYYGEYAGIVRPLLEWNTQAIRVEHE